jgi:hypothetical protein
MLMQLRWAVLPILLISASCSGRQTLRYGSGVSSERNHRPPKLPKDIKKMVGFLKSDISSLVDTMALGTSTVGYIGSGSTAPECSSVNVAITPATGSSDISPSPENGNSYGRVVAVIENLSDCSDNALNLPANHRGVWIALFTSDTSGSSYVVDIDHRVLGLRSNELLPKVSFNLGSCHVTHPGQTADSAAITTRGNECKVGGVISQPGQVPALQGRHRGRDGDDDATMWFNCAATCCYASAFQA